jgi:3-oxoacid CoA-transferase B subunit
MPTLVADHIPPCIHITLHSENGLLRIGPFPSEDEVDPDLINAGKETVTETSRCSYFSSADSFAMVRGGHIDLTVLGALQRSSVFECLLRLYSPLIRRQGKPRSGLTSPGNCGSTRGAE